MRGLKRDGFVRKAERGTGYYLATEELDKLPDTPILQWNAMRENDRLAWADHGPGGGAGRKELFRAIMAKLAPLAG